MTEVYLISHEDANVSNQQGTTQLVTEKETMNRSCFKEFFHQKRIAAVLSNPYQKEPDVISELAKEKQLEVQMIEELNETKESSFLHAFEHILVEYENKKIILSCKDLVAQKLLKFYHVNVRPGECEERQEQSPYAIKLVFEGMRFVSASPME